MVTPDGTHTVVLPQSYGSHTGALQQSYSSQKAFIQQQQERSRVVEVVKPASRVKQVIPGELYGGQQERRRVVEV